MVEDTFLKKHGIKVNRELKREEKKIIVNNIVNLLTNKFPSIRVDSIRLYHFLLNINMYIVNIPTGISYVNYSYQNKAIYFSDEIDTLKFDDVVLHEFLHCIQDKIKENNHMGLCEFNKKEINGLMFNEAANQYIANTILDKSSKRYKLFGITINTKSNMHFSIISNIMEEVAILFGEKSLVNSTVLADGIFKKIMIEQIGMENTKLVLEGFDKIFYLQQDFNSKNGNGITYHIKETYYNTQKLLYTEYFNSIKLEEANLEVLKEKLISLKSKFENTESYDDYILFYDQKMVEIEHYEMSKLALVKVSNNVFSKLFRKLKIFNNAEYNKNIQK